MSRPVASADVFQVIADPTRRALLDRLRTAWSKYAARKRLGVDAIELPGGHCPYLSRPVHLADLLDNLTQIPARS